MAPVETKQVDRKTQRALDRIMINAPMIMTAANRKKYIVGDKSSILAMIAANENDFDDEEVEVPPRPLVYQRE